VLSGNHDPATPLQGAQTLVDALGNGSVILETHNIGHDALRGRCTLERSAQYLLDPASLKSSPPRVACPELAPDQTVVGTVSDVFPWAQAASRMSETALGDLAADAMRAAAGTAIAMVNSGGLRTALPAPGVLPADKTLRRPETGYAAGPPYDIVVDDLRALHPWGNRIITMTVSGAELHDVLEHAVASYDGSKGHSEFPQVSGIRLTFDPGAAPGSRIKTLALDDGTPIAADASASYSFALADFVWYGGTGYLTFLERATSSPALGGFFVDAVIDHFKKNSLAAGKELSPTIAGRITKL
jgi:5'-nucleotidase